MGKIQGCRETPYVSSETNYGPDNVAEKFQQKNFNKICSTGEEGTVSSVHVTDKRSN